MGATLVKGQDFDEYVRANWARLVRAAVLAGCSLHTAEDVVQSALVRCVLHEERVSRVEDLNAYVHRVVFNTLISARRRRWNRERPTEVVPDRLVEGPFAAIDLADVLMRELDSLSQDQRNVIVLRYYAGFDEAQIAEVLGIPPGTVKSRAARALARLAESPALAEERGVR